MSNNQKNGKRFDLDLIKSGAIKLSSKFYGYAISALALFLLSFIVGKAIEGGMGACIFVAVILALAAISEVSTAVKMYKHDMEEQKKAEQKKAEKKEQEENAVLLAGEIKEAYRKIVNSEVMISGTDHFENELSKIRNQFKDKVGHSQITNILYDITRELYFEGNENINKVFIKTFLMKLYRSMMKCENVKEGYKRAEKDAVMITAKALHFEKYREQGENYQTVKSKVESPISGNWIEVDYIRALGEETYYYYYFPRYSDDYYVDSICNLYWKLVVNSRNLAEEEASDFERIVPLIYNNLKPNDDDAIKFQCNACAFEDSCTQKRANCAAFIPKSKS